MRRFYDDLWNRWDLAVAAELLAPDVSFRGTLGTSCTGVEDFLRYVEQVRAAFPDWHNRIDGLIAEGDAVAARMTRTGTHRGELLGVAASGRRVSFPGVGLFDVSAGCIQDVWVVGDTQELWRAIGVLAAIPGRLGDDRPVT